MMSICKTLETIDFCCYRDAYSDAYTLLRKCRDDLMQYLFVLNVIQNKHGLTDEEAEKFTINSESMMKMIELDVSILVSGERKTDAELAMEKWIYNVLESSENKEDRKKFFDTSKYKSYLVSNNEKVKYIFENFLVDKWLREDRKLNNYVHANGIRFVMDNYVYQNKKEDKHKELIETLQNITDIFLSLLSVIDSIKFHSSDYLDALEMETSVYKGYKQDKIEMRGDRAEMSDFPLYLNTVAGGLDRRDQTIGGFSFVVKIYAVPVVEIIG